MITSDGGTVDTSDGSWDWDYVAVGFSTAPPLINPDTGEVVPLAPGTIRLVAPSLPETVSSVEKIISCEFSKEGWSSASECSDEINVTLIDLEFVNNLTTWPRVAGRSSSTGDNVYMHVQSAPVMTLDDLNSMGFPLRVHTSSTKPAGYVDASVDDADHVYTTADGYVTILYKATTLNEFEIFPSLENDSILEFASCDNATGGGGSNHTDSDLFDVKMLAKGFEQRGKARDNGDYASLVSKANYDFMVHGGVQNIWFSLYGVKSEKRQIRDQADWLYWSGHGSHNTGELMTLEAGLGPSNVQWGHDLDVVILAGCSVLDIKDYRAQSFGAVTYAQWLLAGGDWSPGAEWEATGPDYLIGYCWKAPLDSAGSAGIIHSFLAAYTDPASIPAAWGTANDLAIGRNACVIDTSKNPHEYWFWDETSGSPVWTKKVKGGAGW